MTSRDARGDIQSDVLFRHDEGGALELVDPTEVAGQSASLGRLVGVVNLPGQDPSTPRRST